MAEAGGYAPTITSDALRATCAIADLAQQGIAAAIVERLPLGYVRIAAVDDRSPAQAVADAANAKERERLLADVRSFDDFSDDIDLDGDELLCQLYDLEGDTPQPTPLLIEVQALLRDRTE